MIIESLVTPVEVERASNPFPGLRPFEYHENHLFFGRDGQCEELLVKLSKSHFLAVVGTSGSGKSSLVRAGLLPALYGGLMGKSGSGWRIAIMRPGHDPIGNLAEALNKPGALELEDAATRYVQTRVSLRRGGLGLAEIVEQARLMAHENLLILVDQFEELFRFARISEDEDYANDAAAFVKLLLEARRQSNIYVVLTMRSDYLGDCAQFWDLPEAINEGQYLIPRMTREERREAIRGPLAISGTTINAGLVNQLLNDMADRPSHLPTPDHLPVFDQLPILQHALMRIWETWREDGDESQPLDFSHYERIGGASDSLSRHADEAYAELPDERSREIAEKLFKCLTNTDKGADDRRTRRPTELSEICQITGATIDEVVAVIEVFRREGRSFLMPPANVPLQPDCLIDISHESLISGWKKLHVWVDEEAGWQRLYERLAERAILYPGEGTLRGPGLQEALDWREREKPNVAWARRHHSRISRLPEFANQPKEQRDEEIFRRAMALLDESRSVRDAELAEAEQERKKRFRKRFIQISTAIGTGAFLICLVLLLYAVNQGNKAAEQARINAHIRYAAIMNLAQQAGGDYNFARANELLKDFDKSEDGDLRGFEWRYLRREFHNERSTLLQESKSEVLSVAYSTAALRRVAAGQQNGSITLWDSTSAPWRVIATQQPSKEPVRAIAFSEEGLLAAGGADRMVRFWSADTGRPLDAPPLKHDGPVDAVAFSRDGKKLVSVAAGAVKLWDVNREASRFEPLPPPQWSGSGNDLQITCVALSPDGAMLAVGGQSLQPEGGATVKLWSLAEGRELSFGMTPRDRILSLDFSPDGRLLATGGDGRAVKVWDLHTKSELRLERYANGGDVMRHANTISSVRFSPDGKWLASGSWDGTIKLWSTSELVEKENGVRNGPHSPEPLIRQARFDFTYANAGGPAAREHENRGKTDPPESAIYKGHHDFVHAIAFSPDSNALISGSRDETFKLWDVSEPPQKMPPSEEDPGVLSVAVHGTMLATGRLDGTIRLHSLDADKELRVLRVHREEVGSVAFSPDGKILATASRDGKILLWDTGIWEPREIDWGSTHIRSVAFSPDGKLIAAGGKHRNIQLWKVDTRELSKTLETEAEEVYSVAFSPTDGNILASGGTDRRLTLWDLSENRNSKSFELLDVAFSVAFSRHGNLLAVGSSDGMVTLLDTLKREKLGESRAHGGAVYAVVFSPDGKRLASGGYDGVVKLWDTTLVSDSSMVWQEQELIALDWRQITSMTFSPDYNALITGSPAAKVAGSGSNDRAVKIWRASPAEVDVR